MIRVRLLFNALSLKIKTITQLFQALLELIYNVDFFSYIFTKTKS